MLATEPRAHHDARGEDLARIIELTEYRCTPGVALHRDQRDLLRRLVPSLSIQPTVGELERYDLTPRSTVGIARIDNLVFEFRPKIPVDRLLFLLSYSIDPRNWHATHIALTPDTDVLEAVILPLTFHTRQALRRGLLMGYRSTDDSLSTIRGRIRIGDQLRDRFGIFPPIEVRYDEFTEDIDENRILKAAFNRLRGAPTRNPALRKAVREFESAFATVELVTYPRHRVPDINFTRLNEHYRPALGLARLILDDSSIELRHGSSHGTAVLVDMNTIFEAFVYIALREHLKLSATAFPQGSDTHALRLARGVRLRPDLSWWHGNECRFVGDLKYKATDDAINHPDLYQLLAYLVATNLKSGLLIYAAGEAEPTNHQVATFDAELRVRVLGIDGTPTQVLEQIAALGDEIRALGHSPMALIPQR